MSEASGENLAHSYQSVGMSVLLGIEITYLTKGHVEARMPIDGNVMQPFGFLHGGATIALLETVASAGSEYFADFETERPFGIQVNIRHRKSGKGGMLHGVASLDHEEGSKQFWNVAAYDDEGDIISDGVIVTKVASLARLAEKERERARRTSE